MAGRGVDPAIEEQLRAIEYAAQAGCHLVQIREKDLRAGELAKFTRRAISVARPKGTLVLVNDRVDVALVCGADGVHLRTSSLPVAEVRRAAKRLGRNDFLIGVSTHSVGEAVEAESGGADFIVCGPVFATASKIALGPPMGTSNFATICQQVTVPVIALGGVDWQNCHEPLAGGAAGIAGIGLFQPATDLVQKIRRLRSWYDTCVDERSPDRS